ncbi:TIM-barrel signal transduction protein [Balamuthia mandrillaris]
MVPSIVDVAGLNRILRVQFSATAAMVVGMVNETLATQTERNIPSKPVIVASMFGNTTTCVRNAQKLLEEKYGYEVLVFHSVGTGGKAMESILDSVGCDVAGVLDITTTEWADELCGGVMSAGPERLSRPGQLAIPHLIAPGCLDMVNFGPFATVPEKYRTDERRCFYEWNSAVTLMRTNKEENVTLGKILAEKAKAAKGPVAFLLPKKGISILDGDGERFCDREADEALFSSLKENLSDSSANIRIHEVDCNINDEQFSTHAVELLLQLIEGNKNSEKLKEYSTPESKALVSPTLVPSSSLSLPPGLEGDDSLRGRTLKRLWNECIIKRKPIIGAGAGTGISAKFEEAGGADMIIIYNSGRFRMGGRSSLSGLMPYKDANKIVMEMASEESFSREDMLLLRSVDVPVLAGVCGTDPFRDMDRFLRKIKKRGFAGVQNFPTVGLIDGTFRQNLEETGITFKQEVEMIRKARQLGLVTTPYAFNPEDARMMAEAGADIIVAHMGLTTKGSIGASTALTLDESVRLTQEICDAAKEVNPFVIVLCHGGPISMPEDAEYVLRRTNGVHGFYGASSVERLPTEQAITNQLRAFKALSFA